MTKRTSEKSDPSSVHLDENAREASRRSNCYGLLALVFRAPPDSQVVEQLRFPPLADALSHLGCEVAGDLAGDPGAVAERLSEEYTHVLPYASVYHDGEGQLWGDSTVRVKRFIEATGLSFEGNWDSIPDHITIELELMQRLSGYEAELWTQKASATAESSKKVDKQLRRCVKLEEEFLRDYLCVWVPQFCDRLSSGAIGHFYGEMAKLAKSIVLSDAERATAQRRALQPC